jgi:anti-anti-sigma factor
VQIDLHHTHERVTVMTPRGRLDMVAAPALRERVTEVVESGAIHLVMDLGEVTFVDTSGLEVILRGLKMVRERGGNLRIARPNQQLRMVLTLTKLNGVLRPYDDVAEALHDFGRSERRVPADS